MKLCLLVAIVLISFCAGAVCAKEKKRANKDAWKQYVGKPGPSGWRANVIQPDPKDHGPDGFNHHDWDGDVNGDGRLDLVKASSKIRIFLRKNDKGAPDYKMIEVEQPKQPDSVRVKAKPKGVAILEMNGDPKSPEIVIVPEYEAQLWFLTRTGPEKWTNTLMDMPCPESRKKMDNAFLVDLDSDGDMDIATTEENGGWGVVWFENPAK